MSFIPINERIRILRPKGKFYNTTLNNIHATIEEKMEEKKLNFMTIFKKYMIAYRNMIL